MAYKKDQGRMARMAVFWSVAALAFYGCVSLHRTLGGYFESLGRPLRPGLRIPVLGLDVTGALLITAVVLAGTLLLIYRWFERPKTADLLIETEAELRKVTWPTVRDAVSASLVVIVCVVILMAFLAGSDYVLGRWATFLLTGGN